MAIVVGRYEGLYTRGSHISRGRRFVYPKKSYFSRAKPERNMTSEGKQTFISAYNKGHKMVYYTEITHTTTKHFLKLI